MKAAGSTSGILVVSMESTRPVDTPPKNAALDWLYSLMASPLAGSVSAAFSSAVLQPFDVIRTKQQLSRSHLPAYGGFWATARRMAIEEGFIGFFRGLGPTMWRVVPGSSVYFFLLERTTHALKELQGTNGQLLSFHISLLSAAIARGVASVIFLPVTVVKTRFEAMGPSRSYTSTLGALRTIARAEGASALWSGLLPTVLRDVPHSALYYAMYNYTKSLILPLRGPDSRVPIGALNFASGLISGLTATIVSHPFDVIRTRIQTQSAVPSALNPRGMIPMAIKIVREEGLRTFSRGFAPRLLRRSLSPAFTWTFYEELVQLLKR